MGAWGSGGFDNDDAVDFLNDLPAKEVSAIKEILGRIEKQTGYIEAPECNVAIAAAEVIAASKGAPSSDAPSEIAAWIKEKRPTVVPELTGSALKAVGRIKADSELKDLWNEAGRLQEWRNRVEDLVQRLAST
jgi:hypothetical protein